MNQYLEFTRLTNPDSGVVCKQLDVADDLVQNPGSTSPRYAVILDQKLADNRESSTPMNLGNYPDVGLVQAVSCGCLSREQHGAITMTIEVMAMKQHGNLGFPDGEISVASQFNGQLG
ncbi:hypothetical protein T459_16148 [Capsicum annuum]|uniref:Uncharacterized protein n=1 Tax=Capsicum annuum TaxID=4072 RepID=A0A2G2Z7W7_CAPAN|nr:hypothetical protein T459_16148 [Capsicum annuum]